MTTAQTDLSSTKETINRTFKVALLPRKYKRAKSPNAKVVANEKPNSCVLVVAINGIAAESVR